MLIHHRFMRFYWRRNNILCCLEIHHNYYSACWSVVKFIWFELSCGWLRYLDTYNSLFCEPSSKVLRASHKVRVMTSELCNSRYNVTNGSTNIFIWRLVIILLDQVIFAPEMKTSNQIVCKYQPYKHKPQSYTHSHVNRVNRQACVTKTRADDFDLRLTMAERYQYNQLTI